MKHFRLLLPLCLLPFLCNAQYCATPYTVGTTDNDYIDGFELNTILNLASGAGDGSGYTDFTALNTDLAVSNTYTIHFINTPHFSESYRAWIDYNIDGDFTPDEELFPVVSLDLGEEAFLDFTVPPTAYPGETRLRIRCVYGTTDFDACSTETYGEAEDYTINMTGYDYDLAVVSVQPVPEGCDLSTEEPITAWVRNIGLTDATGFNMHMMTDGGAVVTEYYPGTITPGDTLIYTFTAGSDLSADGPHTVDVWCELTGDEFTGNDTASTYPNNLFTYLTTGFPLSLCYGGGTVFPSPIAAGGIWSGDGIIDAETGEFDPSLVGGIGGSTDITYSFTPTDAYSVSPIPFAPWPMFDPTLVSLSDDSYVDAINIGFTFNYFGTDYTKLFIASNGYIGFGAGSNSYADQHIPDPTAPNNMISFCWTDLNPSAGGIIKYEMQGTAPNRRFIVDYKDVPHYSHTETVTAQIIIYESSNMIDLQVTDIQNDGGTMTQGIENADGTIAYVTGAAYNQTPFDMSEKGWRFAVTPCAATVTETINIVEPPVVVIDDAAACDGSTITLDAGTGAEEYAWSTGENTQTINITESGSYWVVYYENPTCYVEDTAEITIYPLPPVNLGADGITCEGTMLDAGNPEDDHIWNTGDTGQTIFITESGTYSVVVTDSVTACQNFDTVTYTITPLPVADFTVTATGPFTISCNNLSTDAVYYVWDFGDGTSSFETDPVHIYPYADDWTVQLIVSNDCGSDLMKNIIQVTNGIHDFNAGNISVYPNPAGNTAQLEIQNQITGHATLQLYDMTGRMVKDYGNIVTNSMQLDLGEISEGNYMLLITGDQTFSLPLQIIK